MDVFVYVLDRFIPTDLTKKEVLNAFKEDELKPFELIREIFDNKIKDIKHVEFYDAYFKCDSEFLIEYLVNFANGTITVKIIASSNPSKTLSDYYRYLQS
ncbi:hypothetical protein DRP04_05020 [Archaeoglobales archaeon]|nr:MAG: hypothetical protein DRP04_05020 [Archaeoglobales archaeon]